MNKKENIDHHFGFLSVLKFGSSTFVGGYLLLNSMGRPIEFHCSEAIKPTRAQEILYGQSLHGYLHSELFGKALINAAKTQPSLLFVDVSPALELDAIVEAPVILVNRESSNEASDCHLQIGNNRVTLGSSARESSIPLASKWPQLSAWDLAEPFQRIHDAILETQKAA